MATTVALEMEEKRRREEWEKMEEETKMKVNFSSLKCRGLYIGKYLSPLGGGNISR
jgi:hypothetical protein